ncbi:hypothetical protein [Streptomyces prasinus]|uniref:hypothetical protein n=1 Tax=Streptomyces prasinus TaxID=67345 RepID=UPI0033A69CC6
MPLTVYPYDNGTVGPTGPEGPQGSTGPAGKDGVVQSVNGKSVKDVVLNAGDVNALPSTSNAQLDSAYLSINRDAGNYRALRFMSSTVSRWELQADSEPETGGNAGSDLRISARNDDGTFGKTTMHARRSDGTVAFGLTTHHGSAQVTANGSVGLRDISTDPATASGGVFLYSKGGVPYFKNADGTSFQVQPLSHPVGSVNGKTGHVNLGASDVNALPNDVDATLNAQRMRVNAAAGTVRGYAIQSSGVDRWTIGTDEATETGSDTGTNFRLTARKDDGTVASTALHVNRAEGQVSLGTEAKHGAAAVTSGGAVGVKDIADDPADATGGVYLYAKDGKPYVKQGDGTVFQVGAGGSEGGAVQSVNGKTGAVNLTATDVGAVPTWGGTVNYSFGVNAPGDTDYGSWYYKKLDKTRWVMQINGTSETGSDAGSDWSLAGYDDAGNWKSTSLFAKRSSGSVGVGTSALMGDARLTVNGAVGVRNLTEDPTASTAGAQVYSKGGLLHVRQGNGTVFQVQPAGAGSVSSVNGETGDVTIGLDDLGGISWTDRGAANGFASLGPDSRLPAAQMPSTAPRNVWTPQALGFQAWSVDPAAVANPTATKAAVIQRLYFAGIYISEPTPVSKVVVFARGWAGSDLAPTARFMAGIYNEAGSRVAWTGSTARSNVGGAGQQAGTPTDAKSNHVGAVPFDLTGTTVLQPGRYWAAFNMTAGSATDFYYFHVQNEAPSNPSNFHLLSTAFMRAGYLPSQTSLPSTITPSSMRLNHDPIIMALA